MSPLDRAEIRRRAESEAVATRARMYEIARQVLAGPARRPAHAGQPDAAPSSRRRSRPRSSSPYAERTAARRRRRSRARRRSPTRRGFVREKNFVTRARRTARDHPDAGVPARRRGRLLRFAGSARHGPAHVLRGVADSRRLDRRRRSIRSCANTTRARSPTSRSTRRCRATTCRSRTRTATRRCCARCWRPGPFVEGWAVYARARDAASRATGTAIRSCSWSSSSGTCARSPTRSRPAIHVDGMTPRGGDEAHDRRRASRKNARPPASGCARS